MENLIYKINMRLNRLLILKSFLLLLFICFLFGFWYFQGFFFLKIFAAALSVLSLYFFLFLKKYDFLILLSFYFALFTLYNIYFSGFFLLWAQMLIVLFLVFVYFYFLILVIPLQVPFEKFYLFLTLISFLILEIFLTLSFWPANVESKSIILVCSFYLLWGLISKSLQEELTLRKIISFLILAAVVFTASVASASWHY